MKGVVFVEPYLDNLACIVVEQFDLGFAQDTVTYLHSYYVWASYFVPWLQAGFHDKDNSGS